MTDDTQNSVVMTKISETADFSTDHFKTLFEQVLDSYEIPSKRFLMDTSEYGEMVKSIIPQFDWWSLIWSKDDCECYAPDEALTPVNGSSLLISKKDLTFAYKVSVSTGFVGNNHEQSRVIIYSPEDGTIEIIETNNPSMNLQSLITYGIYATQNIPGAYTDPVALFNDMTASGQKVSSERISMVANGITYELFTTADGKLGQFKIKADGTIPLNELLEDTTENAVTETTPTQSGALEQLLDGSKSWVGQWEFDDWEYNVHFVFKEDGTCYFALTDETELFGGGKGTYTVKDGNKLSLKITMDGKEKTATYTFNPEKFSLTVTSKAGLVAEKGDIFFLQEDPDNDATQVQNWAERLSDGTVEDALWGV